MSDSERYRRYAANCLRVAQLVSDPGDKTLLLQMAETWRRLAQQAESTRADSDDHSGCDRERH